METVKCKICGTTVNLTDGATTAICHVCGNTVVAEGAVQQTNTAVAPLLQRVFLFLEDGVWVSANEYCERILDIEPQNAYAYFCKLMIDQKVRRREGLQNCLEPFDGNPNYQKALRFGDEALQAELTGYIESIKTRNATNRKEGIYKYATNTMEQAKSTGMRQKYVEAAEKFKEISGYKDAAEKAEECAKLFETSGKDQLLAAARVKLQSDKPAEWENARKTLCEIAGWRDADELAKQCESKIAAYNEQMRLAFEQRKKQAEEARLQQQAAAEERRKQAEELERQQQEKLEKRRKRRPLIIVISIVLVLALLGAGAWFWLIPTINYNKAADLMAAGKYSEAITEFEKLKGFQDSQDQIAKCNAAIVNQKYEAAVALMEEGKYAEAKAAFEALGDYEDCAAKIKECEAAIARQKQQDDYNAAVALMDEGKYAEAKTAFETLGDTAKAEECAAQLVDAENALKYEAAIALMDEGNYAEAGAAFEALGNYKDSADKAKECTLEIEYNEAVALLEKGDIFAAYEALVDLGDYKDSAEKAAAIYEPYNLKTPNVGDYITFGSYEQDNNLENGKEPIEWLVLDIQDGKMLVISKYALDDKCYHVDGETAFYYGITWKNSSLRKWLNNEFMNAAFTDEEKSQIPTVTVPADKNPTYSTNAGDATEDQIFLLSIVEANKYFGFDAERVCIATTYAEPDYDNGSCWWWLRSPGSKSERAALVSHNGSVYVSGFGVDTGRYAVRPAMWINLED